MLHKKETKKQPEKSQEQKDQPHNKNQTKQKKNRMNLKNNHLIKNIIDNKKEQKKKQKKPISCKDKVKQNVKQLIKDFINQIHISSPQKISKMKSMLQAIIDSKIYTDKTDKNNNIATVHANICNFMRNLKPDHLTEKEFKDTCINTIQEYIKQHLNNPKQYQLFFNKQQERQEEVKRRRITDSYNPKRTQEIAKKASNEITSEGYFTKEQYERNLDNLIQTNNIMSYQSSILKDRSGETIGYNHKIVLPYFDRTNNPIIIKSSATIEDKYGTMHIKTTIPNLNNDPKRALLLLLSYLRTLKNTGLEKVNIINLNRKLQAEVAACCKLLKLDTDIKPEITEHYQECLRKLNTNPGRKGQPGSKKPMLPEEIQKNMPKSIPMYS
ncbi:MAG: hypothetical protein PVG30_00535 [Gammaproteobacteria bacterium]|jgi:hypothetical protein